MIIIKYIILISKIMNYNKALDNGAGGADEISDQ